MKSIMFHFIYPIVAIIGYIYYPKDITIPAPILRGFSLVHNALLTAFSGYCVYKLGGALITHGIHFKQEFYFQHESIRTVLWYFYLSKY